MSRSLKTKTQLLVLSYVEQRGSLDELVKIVEVPRLVLWRFARGKTDKIDADICQKIYERLTGHELDIR